MLQKSITLFYPMFNELGHITSITTTAIAVLEALTADYEVLIIDDGSTDGSGKIADDLACKDRHIRVIHQDGNQGYGQALRTGFTQATKEIVVYTDCDEPVDLRTLPGILPLMSSYDMVIGYRLKRNDGWLRFIYSKGYNALVRLLFGVRVRDINFSFKIMRRETLQKLHLSAGSVFIDGELLAEATRNQISIHEIPIDYQERRFGHSNFNSLGTAIYTFREIMAYYRRRKSTTSHIRTESISEQS